MNIVQENTNGLNAILKVTIEKSDYQANVDRALADSRKKANLKGFRKGKVPMNFIKKQYGDSILTDELNKIISKGLDNYITEQELDIFGGPIPKSNINIDKDIDKADAFEFIYEIGLRPKINIEFSEKNKYEYPKIKIDEKLINQQIEDLTRRYGKLISGEEVGDKDMVFVQLVELDESGEIREGGILKDEATISVEFITDDATIKEITGQKVGDKIIVDPFKISRGGKDTAIMLGIDETELDTVSKQFQLTVKSIKKMQPAEINQELFNKLFGENTVTSEKEMRERIEKDLSQMFENDSDQILIRRIYDDLLEKTDIPLPDDFLKQLILETNKNEMTMEQIEDEYEQVGAKGIKRSLITEALLKNSGSTIQHDELLSYAKNLMANQYARYGVPLPDDHELTHQAEHLLHDNRQHQQIYDELANRKLITYFKSTVKLEEKEVDYESFLEIAKNPEA